MTEPQFNYKPSGRFFAVYDHQGTMQDAFLYEENAKRFTDIKNSTDNMDDLQRHNITFVAKKALERLLADEKLTEAADAAVLLTKGTGMIEVKKDNNTAIYQLIFSGRHTGRLNRKIRPRFSPVCILGQIPDSPVIKQIQFFNDRFGK